MDGDSITIGIVVGLLVLLSPLMLHWTVALLDTSGIDRYLPGALFIAVSALVPVMIVCSLSFFVMRHYKGLYPRIKKVLPILGAFLFVALFMLLSIMGAV